MAKPNLKKKTSPTKEKKGVKGNYGKVKKLRKPKKKSIHANTFEERQENIRRKEEAAARKQDRKEKRAAAIEITSNLISNVTAWAKDNPIHPSSIPRPTQEGLQPEVASKQLTKTYKAFIRNLPKIVKAEEIDDHFYQRGVNINCIRVLVHRKTGKCLGWAFLEFKNQMDFEKALNLNVSRFKNERILVEGSLRSFIPSKRKPQKLISYNPPVNRETSMEIEEEKKRIELVELDT